MTDEELMRTLVGHVEETTRALVAEHLFTFSHLSTVAGFNLSDGQFVVAKGRPFEPRLVRCDEVHRKVFSSGFPCPEPIGELTRHGSAALSVERMVLGGALLPRDGDLARRHATWLRRFVVAAPSPEEPSDLTPPVAWLDWDPERTTLWPPADDRAENLNELPSSAWIDELGSQAREVLAENPLPSVIGHGDWESFNLAWKGEEFLSCFDFDSVVCLPEAALAGAAALVHPAQGEPVTADAVDTERFLDAYAIERGLGWNARESRVAWAASLWLQAYNAKKESIDVPNGPLQQQLERDAMSRVARLG
jgi:hypothetical protein